MRAPLALVAAAGLGFAAIGVVVALGVDERYGWRTMRAREGGVLT
jgi:hypothetical protein